MDIRILPGKLQGTLHAIPSKSQAHRLLICAAFSDRPTVLYCPQSNRDIEATVACLQSLGAVITFSQGSYHITPVATVPESAVLPCGESGSTLRFMLPVAGALGVNTLFQMEGRLPYRPLSPMWEEMERMGCQLSRPSENTVRCIGKLRAGNYTIDGGISSQYITGLLFAAALIPGTTHISVTGKIESRPYITMTQQALDLFGISTENFTVSGSRPFRSPGYIAAEGDWSNAAFFLAAQTLGSRLTVSNLDPDSAQGDRAAAVLCSALAQQRSIDASDIPDLVPVLSIVAAANKGAVFHNIQRLRLKESDRVEAVCDMLRSLGGRAEATEDTLTVYGTGFSGGIVDSRNDHRIAMSAAVAATVSKDPVTILNAQCVTKSYPAFWEEFHRLGGHYEQYIR